MRTLILDDDQIFLAVAQSYLAALGASNIQTTTDPAQASDILHNDRIDLVMLDLNMPDKDGLAFLRALSEFGYDGSIIIASGEKSSIVSSSAYIGEKLGLNVCGALAKPLDMAELTRAFECARISAKERLSKTPAVALVQTGKLKPKLLYQPQVSTKTGALKGAEALLRGVDEEGNVFGPSAMLSQLNNASERFDFTEKLFNMFCADIAEMRQAGFENRFSFNVDASNLEAPEFAEILIDTAEKHNLSASNIVIELIESQLPQNEAWLLEIIARLGIAGFEVAMDDFSTGASSFELLRAGAFAEIKLDANLVQQSASDTASAKFIANAVQIAEALDLRIVAEGAESQADVVRMSNFGIDIVQGYEIAKPADKNQLLKNYKDASPEEQLAS